MRAPVRNTVAQSVTTKRSGPRGQVRPQSTCDADIAALLVLDLSGRIRYLNQAAREIFGVSLEQVRGSEWTSCVNVIDRGTRMPIQVSVKSIVNSNKFTRTGFSAVLVSPLGMDVPVEVHVEPFPEPDNVITGAVMIFYGNAHNAS